MAADDPEALGPLAAERLGVPGLAAMATFGMHLLGNPHYGFFRDDLYFIICGLDPQWGDVGRPPIAPLLWSVHFTKR
ncbi:MAG TPA: hypothetical protein VMT70_16125 [Vicinamibacteria bacterium]|nr:hypothetical protein [Vicinamibacteria bacterium]